MNNCLNHKRKLQWQLKSIFSLTWRHEWCYHHKVVTRQKSSMIHSASPQTILSEVHMQKIGSCGKKSTKIQNFLKVFKTNLLSVFIFFSFEFRLRNQMCNCRESTYNAIFCDSVQHKSRHYIKSPWFFYRITHAVSRCVFFLRICEGRSQFPMIFH